MAEYERDMKLNGYDTDYQKQQFDRDFSALSSIYSMEISTPLGGISLGSIVAGAGFIGKLPLIGQIVTGALDTAKSAVQEMTKEINDIKYGGNESTVELLAKIKEANDNYAKGEVALTTEAANLEAYAAVQNASLKAKSIRASTSVITPYGDLDLIAGTEKAQIVYIDDDYVNNMNLYYSGFGIPTQEKKVFNIYRYSHGKYYDYHQGMIMSTIGIEDNIYLALYSIINVGIRLWKTTDPNVFARVDLINGED